MRCPFIVSLLRVTALVFFCLHWLFAASGDGGAENQQNSRKQQLIFPSDHRLNPVTGLWRETICFSVRGGQIRSLHRGAFQSKTAQSFPVWQVQVCSWKSSLCDSTHKNQLFLRWFSQLLTKLYAPVCSFRSSLMNYFGEWFWWAVRVRISSLTVKRANG